MVLEQLMSVVSWQEDYNTAFKLSIKTLSPEVPAGDRTFVAGSIKILLINNGYSAIAN